MPPRSCEKSPGCIDSFSSEPREFCPPYNTVLDPMVIAERACWHVMNWRRQEYERRESKAKMDTVWSQIEVALSISNIDRSEALSRLEQAEGRLLHLLDNTNRVSFQLRGRTLLSFMPCLKSRCARGEVSAENCRETYGLLGQTLRYYQQLHGNHQKDNGGYRNEIEVLALLARSEDPASMAYPTSPREESNSGVRRSTNHDFYVPRDNWTRKVPVQVKTGVNGRSYHSCIFIIRYGLDVLGKLSGREKITSLADDIIADATGMHLTYPRYRLLNKATDLLIGLINDFDSQAKR